MNIAHNKETIPMTKREAAKRLAKLEREYERVSAEIRSLPDGNGFATQKEMRDAASRVYGNTIMTLQDKAS